jgi:hypothetical protein
MIYKKFMLMPITKQIIDHDFKCINIIWLEFVSQFFLYVLAKMAN